MQIGYCFIALRKSPSIADIADCRSEMEPPNDSERPCMPVERRSEPRSDKLRNYRIEIKFVGEPVYQLRVRDVSSKGADILVKNDSAFLDMIEVGQILEVNFLSPKGSAPNGLYRAEIEHISNPPEGRYNGHRLVGISILERLQNDSSRR